MTLCHPLNYKTVSLELTFHVNGMLVVATSEPFYAQWHHILQPCGSLKRGIQAGESQLLECAHFLFILKNIYIRLSTRKMGGTQEPQCLSNLFYISSEKTPRYPGGWGNPSLQFLSFRAPAASFFWSVTWRPHHITYIPPNPAEPSPDQSLLLLLPCLCSRSSGSLIYTICLYFLTSCFFLNPLLTCKYVATLTFSQFSMTA